jgi:hypothetical protein
MSVPDSDSDNDGHYRYSLDSGKHRAGFDWLGWIPPSVRFWGGLKASALSRLHIYLYTIRSSLSRLIEWHACMQCDKDYV